MGWVQRQSRGRDWESKGARDTGREWKRESTRERGAFLLVFQLHPAAGLTGTNECGCFQDGDGESVSIDVVRVGRRGLVWLNTPLLFHLLSARVSGHTQHFQTYHNIPPRTSLPVFLPANLHCLWALLTARLASLPTAIELEVVALSNPLLYDLLRKKSKDSQGGFPSTCLCAYFICTNKITKKFLCLAKVVYQ